MYYKVRISGADFAVFGHPDVRHMNISVQWVDDGVAELFASAVCLEDGKRYLYDWVQHRLAATDTVEITPTDETNVPPPRIKREIRSVPDGEP